MVAKKKKKSKKKTSRRWGLRLLATVCSVLLAGAAVVIFTWPDVAALAEQPPETTAFVERARLQGKEVGWRWVPYDQISQELKKTVVAAEDMSFFSHNGFDTHEIKVAARDAVRGKQVRGASTITQQLAKNLWLTPSRSPTRKIREFILTRQLEDRLSKQRILELYLNVVQFGPNTFGAEAAAREYFGLPAAELDRRQAASLAASLPRPSSWHPGVTDAAYQRSIARISARADQADWIDQLL